MLWSLLQHHPQSHPLQLPPTNPKKLLNLNNLKKKTKEKDKPTEKASEKEGKKGESEKEESDKGAKEEKPAEKGPSDQNKPSDTQKQEPPQATDPTSKSSPSIPKYQHISQIAQNDMLTRDLIQSWESRASRSAIEKLVLPGGFHINATKQTADRKSKPQTHKVFTSTTSVLESYNWLAAIIDLVNDKKEVTVAIGSRVKVNRIGRGGTVLKFSFPQETSEGKQSPGGTNTVKKSNPFYFQFDDFALKLLQEAKDLLDFVHTVTSALKQKEERRIKNKKAKKEDIQKMSNNRTLIEKHLAKDKLQNAINSLQSVLVKPGIPFANLEQRFKKNAAHRVKVNKQAQIENKNITNFILSSVPKEFFEKTPPIKTTPPPAVKTAPPPSEKEPKHVENVEQKSPKKQERPPEPEETEAPQKKEKTPKYSQPGADGMVTVNPKKRKKEIETFFSTQDDESNSGVYDTNPFDIEALEKKFQKEQAIADATAKSKPAPPKKRKKKKTKSQQSQEHKQPEAETVQEQKHPEKVSPPVSERPLKAQPPSTPPVPAREKRKYEPPNNVEKKAEESPVNPKTVIKKEKKPEVPENPLSKKEREKKLRQLKTKKKPKKQWWMDSDLQLIVLVCIAVVVLFSVLPLREQPVLGNA